MADFLATEDPDGGWYSEEAATFGDRVAAGREAVGMTQGALARRLGVKIKTLQSWENDLSEPRANKLQMLAGLLNVSLTWLLSGVGEGVDAPENETPIDADVSALLTEVRQVKSTLVQAGERLGALEKRLRKALKSQDT